MFPVTVEPQKPSPQPPLLVVVRMKICENRSTHSYAVVLSPINTKDAGVAADTPRSSIDRVLRRRNIFRSFVVSRITIFKRIRFCLFKLRSGPVTGRALDIDGPLYFSVMTMQ